MSEYLARFTLGTHALNDEKNGIAKYQLATNKSNQEKCLLKSYFPRNTEEYNRVNNEIVMNTKA